MAPAQKHDRMTFQKDPLVQEWLASVNPSTASTYTLSLLYYCAYLGKTPLDLLKEEASVQERQRRNPLALNHGVTARQRLQDLSRWLQEDHPEHVLVTQIGAGREHGTHRIEHPFRKQTRRTIFKIVGAVRSFYAFKNLTFPRLRLFRRLGKPFAGATTTADIAKALHHADLRTKALIFVAATTGRSPSDLLKLRIGDIDRTRFPGWGFVYDPEQTRQKTGIEQISWLTPEALEHVDRYVSTRPGVNPSSSLFTESQNDREQRLNPDSARRSLQRLAQSVFTNQRENPISFRNLRAWFGTQLDHNRGGYTHKQILLSHAPPYDGAYSRPTVEQLFEDVKVLYDEGYTRLLAGPEEYQLKTMLEQQRGDLETQLRKELRGEIREEFIAVNRRLEPITQDLKKSEEDRKQLVEKAVQVLENIESIAKDHPGLAEATANLLFLFRGNRAFMAEAAKARTPDQIMELDEKFLPIVRKATARGMVLERPEIKAKLEALEKEVEDLTPQQDKELEEKTQRRKVEHEDWPFKKRPRRTSKEEK